MKRSHNFHFPSIFPPPIDLVCAETQNSIFVCAESSLLRDRVRSYIQDISRAFTSDARCIAHLYAQSMPRHRSPISAHKNPACCATVTGDFFCATHPLHSPHKIPFEHQAHACRIHSLLCRNSGLLSSGLRLFVRDQIPPSTRLTKTSLNMGRTPFDPRAQNMACRRRG
jgi:hypothetical protein